MKKGTILLLLVLVFAFSGAASAAIITEVVRSGGASDDRDPIGTYTGETAPLPTEEGGLKDGNLVFSDRTYGWSLTPEDPGLSGVSIVGSEYVRTFNNDKNDFPDVTYTVTTSKTAIVWVTCDDRIPADWDDNGALASQQDAVDLMTSAFAAPGTFVDTGLDLFVHEGENNDRQMSVYAAELPAGTYVFGRQNSGANFYTIGAVEPGIVANPLPEDGATGVALTGTILMWEVDLPDEGPAPSQYDVYFGDSVFATDPNEGDTYYLASVAAGGPFEVDLDTAYGALSEGVTYYWRVDAFIHDDANSVAGPGWSFTAIRLAPVIVEQPKDVRVGMGCSGELSISAINREGGDETGVTYQWYADGAIISGATEKTLAVSEPGVAYHCVVGNDIGAETVSEAATLEEIGMVSGAGLVSEGLLGYWPFDGDATDASGNGYDLTQSGDPQFVEGQIGEAIECDGAGDYFTNTAFGAALQGNDAITIVMWIKSNQVGADEGFLHFVDPAGQDRYGIRYDSTGSNSGGSNVIKYGVGGSNGEQQELETTENVQTTEWQHLALTWSGANEDIKFYIDGVLNPPQSSDAQATGTLDNNYALIHIGLGGKDDNMSGEGWDGLIDDVAIYNRVLSPEEIQTIMAGKGGWAPTDPTYDPPMTADGWIDPTVELTLGWTKAELGPCDGTYRVLLGQEPNALRMVDVGTATDTSINVPASMFDYDLTYYWQVIVEREGEAVAGPFWSFDTVKRVPVVLANPATYVSVDAGETASLAAQASCLKVVPMTKYVWLKEGDPSFSVTVNAPVATSETEDSYIYDCTLDLTDTDVAKEGTYYCTLFNSATGSDDFTSTTGALILTMRLVLHYALDEIVDGTVADSSDSGIAGTLVSRTGDDYAIYGDIEAGVIDGAIRLLGNSDPNSAVIDTGKTSGQLGVDGNKPRSVSVWAKTQLFNNGGIWDAGTNADLSTWGVRTLANDTYRVDRWRVQHYGSDNTFTIDGSTNVWLHFVYVYDGSRFQLYVNGEQRYDVARALTTGNDKTVKVGAYNNNAFDGAIDDFRMYNYALSAKEIAQLYVDVAGGELCLENPQYDFNNDCTVNLADFAEFAAEWMNSAIVTP